MCFCKLGAAMNVPLPDFSISVFSLLFLVHLVHFIDLCKETPLVSLVFSSVFHSLLLPSSLLPSFSCFEFSCVLLLTVASVLPDPLPQVAGEKTK